MKKVLNGVKGILCLHKKTVIVFAAYACIVIVGTVTPYVTLRAVQCSVERRRYCLCSTHATHLCPWHTPEKVYMALIQWSVDAVDKG